MILWYQRPVGDSALNLIGYISYDKPDIEKTFTHYFNITGNGASKSQLHVLKLRKPEDTGTYYCVASIHNEQITFIPLQKPPLITDHANSVKKAQLHQSTGNYYRYQQQLSINLTFTSDDKHFINIQSVWTSGTFSGWMAWSGNLSAHSGTNWFTKTVLACSQPTLWQMSDGSQAQSQHCSHWERKRCIPTLYSTPSNWLCLHSKTKKITSHATTDLKLL